MSRIDLHRLARDHNLPLCLLGIGLPLTTILGTLVAAVMFGALPLWEAAILGQRVVTNPASPAGGGRRGVLA